MMKMADGDMEMEEGVIWVAAPDDISIYTPFQAFQMDHSPGHVPPFAEEHFDFHFYFQNDDIRFANITGGEPPKVCGNPPVSPDTWCRGLAPFPKGCCPPLYLNIAAIVPGMGAHLIDLMSGEVQKPDSPYYHPWTIEMTLGAFNGRITFFEPMIPFRHFKDVIAGNVTLPECGDIRLPEEFPDIGYYPSQFCVDLTPAGNFRVYITRFVHYATAGCKGPLDYNTMCGANPPPPGSPPPTADFLKYCTSCKYE